MIVIFPEADIHLGPCDPKNGVASGCREENGHAIPHAALAPATRPGA